MINIIDLTLFNKGSISSRVVRMGALNNPLTSIALKVHGGRCPLSSTITNIFATILQG